LTEKLDDIFKICDSRMLRYMARVRGQDRISSEKVVKRCDLKMIQDKLRQKRLQWFGHVRREEMEVSGKGKKEDQGKPGKI